MRWKVTFLLGTILLLAAVTPSFAQSHSMVVNVPFGFTVGQKAYPAGKYVVTACDPSTSSTCTACPASAATTRSRSARVPCSPQTEFTRPACYSPVSGENMPLCKYGPAASGEPSYSLPPSRIG